MKKQSAKQAKPSRTDPAYGDSLPLLIMFQWGTMQGGLTNLPHFQGLISYSHEATLSVRAEGLSEADIIARYTRRLDEIAQNYSFRTVPNEILDELIVSILVLQHMETYEEHPDHFILVRESSILSFFGMGPTIGGIYYHVIRAPLDYIIWRD